MLNELEEFDCFGLDDEAIADLHVIKTACEESKWHADVENMELQLESEDRARGEIQRPG